MLTYIAGIAFVLLLGGLIYYQKVYKKSLKIKSPYEIAFKAEVIQTTPKGSRIGTEGNEKMSGQTLQIIDEGVTANTRRIERLHPDYTWKFTAPDFKVVLLDAELSESGAPGFKVPIPKDSPYIHTEYNKGTKDNPYLLAGGLMVAVGEPHGNIIAVPKPISNNWIALRDGVDFELEHIQAAYNDPEKFEATKYHTENGHPIYSDNFSLHLVGSFNLPFVCITDETLIGDIPSK